MGFDNNCSCIWLIIILLLVFCCGNGSNCCGEHNHRHMCGGESCCSC